MASASAFSAASATASPRSGSSRYRVNPRSRKETQSGRGPLFREAFPLQKARLERALWSLPHTSTRLPRCLGPDRQGVHRACEFRCERVVNHTMAFDAALPFEGRRHDINPEVGLAAWPVSRMALVKM